MRSHLRESRPIESGFLHIFFHGLALRLGMTTLTTFFVVLLVTARLLNQAAEGFYRRIGCTLLLFSIMGRNPVLRQTKS